MTDTPTKVCDGCREAHPVTDFTLNKKKTLGPLCTRCRAYKAEQRRVQRAQKRKLQTGEIDEESDEEFPLESLADFIDKVLQWDDAPHLAITARTDCTDHVDPSLDVRGKADAVAKILGEHMHLHWTCVILMFCTEV